MADEDKPKRWPSTRLTQNGRTVSMHIAVPTAHVDHLAKLAAAYHQPLPEIVRYAIRRFVLDVEQQWPVTRSPMDPPP